MITAETYLPSPHSFAGITIERFQTFIVWLMFASTFVAIIEPAPSDILFIVVLFSFLGSGLKVNRAVAPMVLFLLLYNIGALMSYTQIPDDYKARMFVVTSTYMAVSAIFLAFYIADDTLRRAALIKNALVMAGVIATIIAIAGYFSIGGFQGGSPEYQSDVTAYNRADGLFKDPNVYATYVLFPILLLVQGFMLGTQRYKVISAISLFILMAGLFLAFSRGAWISFVTSSVLLVGLTFILTPSNAMRKRIILFFIIAAICCAVMLVLLLSIEQVSNLFFDRFTLIKNYDSAETGRFANQLNSIPLLLQLPLGFGPLQFTQHFLIAPHNTYINSFSSYGWLGGVSYFILITLTLMAGVKSVFTPTPWQNFSIVVFCPLISTIFQGVQIDTDHWRHFYWLLGLNWGMFAASLRYAQQNPQKTQHVV